MGNTTVWLITLAYLNSGNDSGDKDLLHHFGYVLETEINDKDYPYAEILEICRQKEWVNDGVKVVKIEEIDALYCVKYIPEREEVLEH